MKPTQLIALLIALLSPAHFAIAQGGGPSIQAKTFMQNDGGRVEVVKNLEDRTSEHKQFDESNKLVMRTLFQLDEDGREISGTIYNPKNVEAYHFTYKLDSSGRVIEQDDYTPDNKLLRKMVYRFRTDGNVLGIDVYDAQGQLLSGPSMPKTNTPKSSNRRR